MWKTETDPSGKLPAWSRLRKRVLSSIVLLAVFFSFILVSLDTGEREQQPDPHQRLHGKVTRVADGDTITLWADGKKTKVRLQGIDCPEQDQLFGKQASHFLRDLILNREVEVQPLGQDSYGRVLGEVFYSGKNLNKELLKQGYAWWYQTYAKDRRDYRDLEQEARNAKRGLWSDPQAIPPWEFRKNKRSKPH